MHYAFSAKNANSLNKFMVMENGIRPGLRFLKQNLHRSMQNTIMRESISVKQRMQLCQKLNRTHSRLACFTEVLLSIRQYWKSLIIFAWCRTDMQQNTCRSYMDRPSAMRSEESGCSSSETRVTAEKIQQGMTMLTTWYRGLRRRWKVNVRRVNGVS